MYCSAGHTSLSHPNWYRIGRALHFARTFAADLKGRKTRVNTLSPEPIDTPIIDGQFKTADEAAAGREQMASLPVLGRLGTAEEMADAAFFLASDESSYCTGIDLYADGGLSQRF